MNGDDRNLLKDIYTQCAKIENLENEMKAIKLIVSKPIFQRMMTDAELHIGDQESLMKKLGKSYGYKKQFSGWDLLDKGFEKLAVELERKNNFINSFLHATAFKVIQFLCILGMVLFLILGGK